MKNIPDGLLDDVVKRLVDGLQLIILSSFFIISGCTFLSQPNNVAKNSASDISKGTEVSLPITFQLHDVPHNPRKQKGTD
ncbi:MAG: Peptidase 2 protein, partial [Candidatus Poribacteria bacterium]|nr:Peptidase 2 protein [Candidatus Poribacteria bacterium]